LLCQEELGLESNDLGDDTCYALSGAMLTTTAAHTPPADPTTAAVAVAGTYGDSGWGGYGRWQAESLVMATWPKLNRVDISGNVRVSNAGQAG
jgi:hypothetical protein